MERKKCCRKVKRFTHEEDALIKKFFHKYSASKAADKLSALMDRSKRSIRERYTKFLSLDSRPFSKEEDQIILDKHAEYGNKWKIIASFLQSKSDIQTRIRFKQLTRETNCIEMEIHDINHNNNDDDKMDNFFISEGDPKDTSSDFPFEF